MNPKLHTALKKCSKSGMGTFFVTGASLYCFIQPPKTRELWLGEPYYDVIKLEQHQHVWPGMDSNQWIGSPNRDAPAAPLLVSQQPIHHQDISSCHALVPFHLKCQYLGCAFSAAAPYPLKCQSPRWLFCPSPALLRKAMATWLFKQDLGQSVLGS